MHLTPRFYWVFKKKLLHYPDKIITALLLHLYDLWYPREFFACCFQKWQMEIDSLLLSRIVKRSMDCVSTSQLGHGTPLPMCNYQTKLNANMNFLSLNVTTALNQMFILREWAHGFAPTTQICFERNRIHQMKLRICSLLTIGSLSRSLVKQGTDSLNTKNICIVRLMMRCDWHSFQGIDGICFTMADL